MNVGHAVRSLYRAVRPRPKSHAVVLMYHRVAECDIDPWNLCVSPQRFADQIAALKREFCILPLHELIRSDARRKRRCDHFRRWLRRQPSRRRAGSRAPWGARVLLPDQRRARHGARVLVGRTRATAAARIRPAVHDGHQRRQADATSSQGTAPSRQRTCATRFAPAHPGKPVRTPGLVSIIRCGRPCGCWTSRLVEPRWTRSRCSWKGTRELVPAIAL